MEILSHFSETSQWLITELFWKGNTEAEIGHQLGISQQAVAKRKKITLAEMPEIERDNHLGPGPNCCSQHMTVSFVLLHDPSGLGRKAVSVELGSLRLLERLHRNS